MKISESHNERTEHQEDEQTGIDIRTLITKNSVVALYADDPEYQFYIMKVRDEPHVVNRVYLMTGDVHSQGVPTF